VPYQTPLAPAVPFLLSEFAQKIFVVLEKPSLTDLLCRGFGPIFLGQLRQSFNFLHVQPQPSSDTTPVVQISLVEKGCLP
jgi:hypothetical protein